METNKFHTHAWCCNITMSHKYRVPVNYYYNDHVDRDVLNTDMYDHRKGKIASITCNLSSNMKPTLICKNKITKRKIIYSSKDE